MIFKTIEWVAERKNTSAEEITSESLLDQKFELSQKRTPKKNKV